MPDILTIELGDRSYQILFAEDLAAEVRALALRFRAVHECLNRQSCGNSE